MSFLSSYPSKKISKSLDGERVYLRSPEYRDWEKWSETRRENMSHLKPWEPTWPLNDLERSSFLRRVKVYEKLISNDEAYPFLIFDKYSNELIGELNINNVQRGVLQSCSIGYWISKNRIGLGFMSESIMLIKNFIFNELGLHRIEAACLESNEPSLNVLKKSTLRNFFWNAKVQIDDIVLLDHLLKKETNHNPLFFLLQQYKFHQF